MARKKASKAVRDPEPLPDRGPEAGTLPDQGWAEEGEPPPATTLDKIHESIRHLAVPVGELLPDPANTRQHGERNLAVIAASLAEFGQDQPVVVRRATGTLIKGNGRLAAAKTLGWTHLAALYVDDDTMEAMRRGIVDNRAGELAGWEHELLGKHLAAVVAGGGDIETLGFSQADLQSLVVEWPDAPGGDAPGAGDGPGGDATFLVKVEDVSLEDKQKAVDAVQAGLDAAGLSKYRAKLL